MIAVRKSTSDSRLWIKEPSATRSRFLLAESGRAHGGAVASSVFRMLSSSQSDIVSRMADSHISRSMQRCIGGDRRSLDTLETLDLTFADASQELPSALSKQMRHINMEYLELQEELEHCQQDLARIMIDLAHLRKQRSCLSTRLKFLQSLVSAALHTGSRIENNEDATSSGKSISECDGVHKQTLEARSR